jgi:hypothetical protein
MEIFGSRSIKFFHSMKPAERMTFFRCVELKEEFYLLLEDNAFHRHEVLLVVF